MRRYKGDIQGRRNGVLISNDQGEAVAYAMFKLEDRGPMMIEPGWKVYRGMIVGEHTRDNDLEINVLKGKQLTNIRTTSKDEAVRLTPPIRMTLEKALAYIEDDELVEVTPKSIRLRKKFLDPNDRKRAEKAKRSGGVRSRIANSGVANSGRFAAIGSALCMYDLSSGTFADSTNAHAQHVPPLRHRCRHHRRRRRRPRCRACAEEFRPLRHRAGSARPRRRPRPHHHGRARHHLRPRLRLAAFGRTKIRSSPSPNSLNFEIDKTRPPWREQSFDNGFPLAGARRFHRGARRLLRPRRGTPRKSGRDSAASLYLEPGNRWNPMIDAISTYINGCELDRVSILDMDAYEDTEINWRVRRGYGALMAAYGAHCPLALNTQVTRIDHSGKRVRIETSQGTLTAGKVIVTVPTNLIADEAIRFHPALPAKVDAARGLPLGLADKVMLALDEPTRRCRRTAACAAPPCAPRWARYHLRPFGQPCIEGFFGGRFAQRAGRRRRRRARRASHRRDRGAARLDFRRKLKPLSESRWAHRPVRARLLFARAARPRRQARRAGRARR